MKALRPLGLLVAVAGAGFAGALAVGAVSGLPGGSLVHLAALIVPAVAVTVLATGIARAALGRASIRVSIAAVAAVGAAAGLANLAALAMLMIVSRPDTTLVGVLLIYAAAAGVGAALALGSARARAIGRLASVTVPRPTGHHQGGGAAPSTPRCRRRASRSCPQEPPHSSTMGVATTGRKLL